MDSSIPIPGTQVRFGLDGLIGLIPGIGDTAGAIVSSYILAEAAQIGAPKSVLLKMAFNIGLDAILGIVPILGDFSDFVWKANQRNVLLLNDFLDQPQKNSCAQPHVCLYFGDLSVRCCHIDRHAGVCANALALVVHQWSMKFSFHTCQ